MSKDRAHLHDELIGPWCECGDGPFTRDTWDDHRMALLGELPVTVEESRLLDRLDRRISKRERDAIEARLSR